MVTSFTTVTEWCHCLYFVVTDEILENVALNKSSRQVNALSASYTEENGNDGNFSTCVHSAKTRYRYYYYRGPTDPWWAVDLGSATSVYQVRLTNAGRGMYTCLQSVYSDVTLIEL